MKITSSGELEAKPGTQDMSGPWAHIQSRWCGSLGTWRSGAWLFPGRLGTWGLLPSFQWPPWETWSSCCTFPGILGKWSLLPSFRWIPLETCPPCWYTHVSSKPNFSILTTSCSGFRNLVAQAFRLRKKISNTLHVCDRNIWSGRQLHSRGNCWSICNHCNFCTLHFV